MKSNTLQFKPLPQTPAQRLEPLYAQVPPIACQGLCQASCGPITFSPVEVDNLRARGLALPVVHNLETMTCSALDTETGRCTIYEARPLICRLWAVVPGMPCPWGCVPADLMTREKARVLRQSVMALAAGEEYCTIGYLSPEEQAEAISEFIVAKHKAEGML